MASLLSSKPTGASLHPETWPPQSHNPWPRLSKKPKKETVQDRRTRRSGLGVEQREGLGTSPAPLPALIHCATLDLSQHLFGPRCTRKL